MGYWLVGLIIVLFVFGPLATIWALNTIFNVGVAYSFKTWLATLVLCATVSGSGAKSK